MATINQGSGADIIVPATNGTTYRGLAGDDTYIISNFILQMHQSQLLTPVVQINSVS